MVIALVMAGYRPSRVPVNGPRPVRLLAAEAERAMPDASARNAVTRPMLRVTGPMARGGEYKNETRSYAPS
jgi:hypothetical protein